MASVPFWMFASFVISAITVYLIVWPNTQSLLFLRNMGLQKFPMHRQVIHFFLGLQKHAPVLAADGGMAWDSCEVRWKASMVSLPTSRVASEIFYWDLSVGGAWISVIFVLQEVWA